MCTSWLPVLRPSVVSGIIILDANLLRGSQKSSLSETKHVNQFSSCIFNSGVSITYRNIFKTLAMFEMKDTLIVPEGKFLLLLLKYAVSSVICWGKTASVFLLQIQYSDI